MTPPENPEKTGATDQAAQQQQKKKIEQAKAWSKAGNQGADAKSSGKAAGESSLSTTVALDKGGEKAIAGAEILKERGEAAGKPGPKTLEASKDVVGEAPAPADDTGKDGKKIGNPKKAEADKGSGGERDGKIKVESQGEPSKPADKNNRKDIDRGSPNQRNDQTRNWTEAGKGKAGEAAGEKPGITAGEKIKIREVEKTAEDQTKTAGDLAVNGEKAGTAAESPEKGKGKSTWDRVLPSDREMTEIREKSEAGGKDKAEHPFITEDGKWKTSEDILDGMLKRAEGDAELIKDLGLPPDAAGGKAKKPKLADLNKKYQEQQAGKGKSSEKRDWAGTPTREQAKPEVEPLITEVTKLQGTDPSREGDRPRNLFQILGKSEISADEAVYLAAEDQRDELNANDRRKETDREQPSDRQRSWKIGFMGTDLNDQLRDIPNAGDRAAVCAGVAAAAFTIFSNIEKTNQEGTTKFGRKDFQESIKVPIDINQCIRAVQDNAGDRERVNAQVLRGVEIARAMANSILQGAGIKAEDRRQALTFCALTQNAVATKVLRQDAGTYRPVKL